MGQAYQPRQAAYDLKKLRGKVREQDWKQPPLRSEATPEELNAMTALTATKCSNPCSARVCYAKLSPKPDNSVTLDQHYETVLCGMRGIFGSLGIAA